MRKRDQEHYGYDTERNFVVDFSKIGEKEHFFIPLKRIFQLNCKWDRGLDLDSALSILRLDIHCLPRLALSPDIQTMRLEYPFMARLGLLFCDFFR